MKSNDILVSIILAIGFFGILGFIDFFVDGIVSYFAYDVSVSFDIVSTAPAALVIAVLGASMEATVSSDLGGRSFNN